MFAGVTYGGLRWCSKAVTAVWLGFAAIPAAAETVHLLALGDSLTQGYGLMEGEGFVPQLQSWLDARGHDIIVMNAGVSGDTTAGGLSRVEWSLTPEVRGMIVTLGGNDLLRGIDPAAARNNIEGILKVAQAQDIEVLLIGMSAPGNYGADYKAAFDAIYPDLAERYDTLYLDSFFAGLMTDGEMPSDLGAVMQADGIHPNPEGVRRIVEVVGPKVEDLLDRITERMDG